MHPAASIGSATENLVWVLLEAIILQSAQTPHKSHRVHTDMWGTVNYWIWLVWLWNGHCNWKTMPNDDHIIYCENIVFRWHNNCYGCIHTEKCCIMHIHTYETKKLVSLITKWTLQLKMMPNDDHIIYCENIVSKWYNNCHSWICTEKC